MTAEEVRAAMRSLPLRGLDDIIGRGCVLILAPHADDESLGCGGLIAEACACGRPPFVLTLTDGVGSHPRSATYPPERLRGVREDEARRAVAALGLRCTRIGFLALPDTKAPRTGAVFRRTVSTIVELARKLGCTAVAAPWQFDPHCDHVAAHCMAAAVARQVGVRHLAYPVWGWMLPPQRRLRTCVAGSRLDVTRHLPAKRRAIAEHRSQLGKLIIDDPTGFCLPIELLSIFDIPYEVFLSVR